MRVLFDTDITLDIVLEREPFVNNAKKGMDIARK